MVSLVCEAKLWYIAGSNLQPKKKEGSTKQLIVALSKCHVYSACVDSWWCTVCEVDLKYKSRFDCHIKTARHLALAGVCFGDGSVGDNEGFETPNSPDN